MSVHMTPYVFLCVILLLCDSDESGSHLRRY